MPLTLTLIWGETLVAAETVERAKAAATAVIEQAGLRPEQVKAAADTWQKLDPQQRNLARAKTGPHIDICRLSAIWVSAENAAEAILEQGLTNPHLVSCRLDVIDHA